MSEILRHVPPDDETSRRLHQHLAQAGQALLDDEFVEFALTIASTEKHDDIAAGLKGEIAFTSAHVSEVWVDDELRGQGIGTQLLGEAEAVAREHHCTRIHLETRSPKARDLYIRLGYEVFGELPNYEGENALSYLTKTL